MQPEQNRSQAKNSIDKEYYAATSVTDGSSMGLTFSKASNNNNPGSIPVESNYAKNARSYS